MRKKRKLALLSIDPGLSTGMAVVSDPDGFLIATTTWQPEQIRVSLDALIRSLHLEDFTIWAVVERMPHVGKNSPLEQQLEAVRRDIEEVLDIFDILVLHTAPGEWKPSRAARTAVVPREWDGKPVSVHQRDAIRMACYRLERKYAKKG